MDFIIVFFRDVLDGPLYIVVTVICSILICSCIGYLAENSINKKNQKEQYGDSHSEVGSGVANSGEANDIAQVDPIQVSTDEGMADNGVQTPSAVGEAVVGNAVVDPVVANSSPQTIAMPPPVSEIQQGSVAVPEMASQGAMPPMPNSVVATAPLGGQPTVPMAGSGPVMPPNVANNINGQ